MCYGAVLANGQLYTDTLSPTPSALVVFSEEANATGGGPPLLVAGPMTRTQHENWVRAEAWPLALRIQRERAERRLSSRPVFQALPAAARRVLRREQVRQPFLRLAAAAAQDQARARRAMRAPNRQPRWRAVMRRVRLAQAAVAAGRRGAQGRLRRALAQASLLDDVPMQPSRGRGAGRGR